MGCLSIFSFLQHCQPFTHPNPERKGQLEPVYLHNSKGEKKLYALADYIKIVLKNEIGILTVQFVWKNSAGEELMRICDVNDSQIGHVKLLLRQIEFVHEVYFFNFSTQWS